MIIKNDKKEGEYCNNTHSNLCALAALTGIPGTSPSGTGNYSISGTITGLTMEGLVLQNASVDDITIMANATSFTFPAKVTGQYSVTIKKQPSDKVCTVNNGSGIAQKDITGVNVYCCHRMGGSIQGCPLKSPSNVTTMAGIVGANGSTNGTGANALFFYPSGIATDGINLYIADTYNHLIRGIEISSGVVTTIAGTADAAGAEDGPGAFTKFNYPGGITTDGTFLYVADTYNHTIRKIEMSNGIVTTLAGTAGVTGTKDGLGIYARFNYPLSITMNTTDLYVTDGLNHTIRKINIASRVVTTLAGLAETEGSTDGTGTSALFNTPFGIVTDGTNLYVTASNSIRRIVISTGVVTTLAGVAGVTGSANGIGSAAQFAYSTAITTDGTNLFVTDTDNETIRQIEISTGVVTTLVGTTHEYGSADGAGAAALFSFPYGITTDGTSLYVSDNDNNTIRKISDSSSGTADSAKSFKERFYTDKYLQKEIIYDKNFYFGN